MITTVLFDLDGTLLPMDTETFAKSYFTGIAAKVAPHGYEPKALIDTIWAGTAAMVKNTGECTNEEAFWRFFAEQYGEASLKDIPIFDAFYEKEFHEVRKVCGYNPEVPRLIHDLQARNVRLVLATNPIFPRIATEARLGWAGLDSKNFELITTYDNSRHCKPNPDYYRDILKAIGESPESCIMVGNDVGEDMIAAQLGMKVFLLTDCIINKKEVDISAYPHGDIHALAAYLQEQIGAV